MRACMRACVRALRACVRALRERVRALRAWSGGCTGEVYTMLKHIAADL